MSDNNRYAALENEAHIPVSDLARDETVETYEKDNNQ